MGDRAKAGALAARKDQALHWSPGLYWRLLDLGEFAVIPADSRVLDEANRDALRRLPDDNLGGLAGDLAATRIALEDGKAERADKLEIVLDLGLDLQHHAAQFRVDLTGLDEQRRVRIAFKVRDLLRGGIGPDPDLALADDVPKRHNVRPAVAAGRGANHGALVIE